MAIRSRTGGFGKRVSAPRSTGGGGYRQTGRMGSRGGSMPRGGGSSWRTSAGTQWQRPSWGQAGQSTQGYYGQPGYGQSPYGSPYGDPYSYGGYGPLGYGGQSGMGGLLGGLAGAVLPWLVRGPMTGLGPKGYQRGDQRIEEDVCDRLMAHGYLDAREIEVKVNNGEVTLEGTVEDRDARRLAEDIAASVSGVRDVMNRLRTRDQRGSGLFDFLKD